MLRFLVPCGLAAGWMTEHNRNREQADWPAQTAPQLSSGPEPRNPEGRRPVRAPTPYGVSGPSAPGTATAGGVPQSGLMP